MLYICQPESPGSSSPTPTPTPRNSLSNVFLMMLKFPSDSLRRVWWRLWSPLSRRDGSMLCGLCWGSLPGHLLWFSEVPLLEGMCDSDTGGQTSQVAFANPQILRPELCNHVESWCFWRSCLRVSWFIRNYLTVTVKTEECWGFRPPPVSLTSPLCTDRQRPPCPPLPLETISERTPPTCGTASVLV